MEARGRVRPGLFDGVSVRYEPTARDLERTRYGLVTAARMMFAVGAHEVYPGISGFPEILRSERELDALEGRPLRRADVHLVASHLFGTAYAASEGRGVVDEELRVSGVRGLHVMDASVFPTNLGVNPQHSIMGVVWCASETLADRASSRAAA
jgi:choline dehydrogenase-like flavoprotein